MIVTSLMTLLTASCASCFAAVFLTEGLEPVSNSRRSLSNLNFSLSLMIPEYGRELTLKSCLNWQTGPDAISGFPTVYLGLFTGGFSERARAFKSPLMYRDFDP